MKKILIFVSNMIMFALIGCLFGCATSGSIEEYPTNPQPHKPELPNWSDSSTDEPNIEIVFDKTTYTLACEFFDYEFKIPVAEKGLKNNFYIPINNIKMFKAEYMSYQNKFNTYIYECSKPKTVKGIQKIDGSTVVREEIAETVTMDCKKFDTMPAKLAFNVWLINPSKTFSIDEKEYFFRLNILTNKDMENMLEYNSNNLYKMMDDFESKVNEYNRDKNGEIYKFNE